MGTRRAFTILELLIAITVMVLLTCLLCTVISSVREQARSVRCVSNVRQIAMGALLWGQDSNGRLLPWRDAQGGNWKEALHDTLESNATGWTMDKHGGNVLQDCPNWKGRVGGDGWFGYSAKGQGYMLNSYPGRPEDGRRSSGWSGDGGRIYPLGTISHPQGRILVCDGDLYDEEWDPVPSRYVVDNVRYLGNRHRRGSSWAFLDGHAGSFRHKEMDLWQGATWIASRPEYWMQWDNTWKNGELWKALFDPAASQQ